MILFGLAAVPGPAPPPSDSIGDGAYILIRRRRRMK
jgi:hypothetical protein